MILFYLLLLLIIIIGLKTIKFNGIFSNYLDQDNTLYFKGIFVFMVILAHFGDYIIYDGVLDKSYEFVNLLFNQLIVTMFFFYSGYGIFESVKIKGKQYIIDFPKKRLLIVWVSFVICVSLYLIGGWILGNSFSFKQIVLSYIAWDNLGNSNWFMFVTFAAYILFYISFIKYNESKPLNNLLFFTGLLFLLMVFLYFTKSNLWYDTIICLPLGMWFSYYKESIDEYMNNNRNWISSIILLISLFICTYLLGAFIYHPIYIITSACFSLIIVLLSMKLKLNSSILRYLGSHVFSIYMLQRLVFMFMSLVIENKYILFVISVLIILFLSSIFDKIMNKLKYFCSR